MNSRDQIVDGVYVVGMHRSGTSMLTALLEMCGFFVGSPQELLPPASDNPAGFWERRDVKELNEQLLGMRGASWDFIPFFPLPDLSDLQMLEEIEKIKSGMTVPWAIKDPRLCLTLGDWVSSTADRNHLVLIHRHPLAVAHSLSSRNSFSINHAILLWEQYLVGLLHQIEALNLSVTLVSYEELVAEPIKSIKEIVGELRQRGFETLVEPDQQAVREFVRTSYASFARMSVFEGQSLTMFQARLTELLGQGDLEGAIEHAREKHSQDLLSLQLEQAEPQEQSGISPSSSSEIQKIGLLEENALLLEENNELNRQRDLFETEYTKAIHSLELQEEELTRARRLLITYRNELNRRKLVLSKSESKVLKLDQQLRDLSQKLSALERAHVVESDKLKVRLSQKSAEEAALRDSLSFRLGWLFTRPVGIVYDQLIKSPRAAVSFEIMRLVFKSPQLVLSRSSYRTLFNALRNESAAHMLHNLQRKNQGAEPEQPRLPTSKQLKSTESKILEFVDGLYLPVIDHAPKVSIIILNRDGFFHLKMLAEYFQKNTVYSNYEIILVDNGSVDGSLDFLEEYWSEVRIIRNSENRSFSAANNQAVLESSGSMLLFLNNDVMPLKGWLTRMVYFFQEKENHGAKVGAVGSRLLYPTEHPLTPLSVQHSGISFLGNRDFIRPINLGLRDEWKPDGEAEEFAAVSAACLLVKKSDFDSVGGFDEEYIYGYEDVDLCLKLKQVEGLSNYTCQESILFHNEFGTQDKDQPKEVRKRRLNNISIFKRKWGEMIYNYYWDAMLQVQESLFCAKDVFKVALTVTSSNPETKAGDYFTGLELKQALESLGWEVVFLSRESKDWLNVPEDVDVVISLLDAWNPSQIKCKNRSLIKIAWARNWFERWAESGYFHHFDLVFTSSKKSIPLFRKYSGAPIHYMPIATNAERFLKGVPKKKYLSDYCFTGSFWGDRRFIIDNLSPSDLDEYQGAIFGANWDQVPELAELHRGAVNYLEMPDIYASTKVVIDDATWIVDSWGSLNSRVFDAIGAGRLLVTNGRQGVDDLFESTIPIYRDRASLTKLLRKYLDNDVARTELVEAMQSEVLARHTYVHRANQIRDTLNEWLLRRSFMIKIPVPDWKQASSWGDFHFALALQRSFSDQGVRSKIQVLSDWHGTDDIEYQNVIVIRGLSQYEPKAHHCNLMWQISHPDQVERAEYELYDHVFVASKSHAEWLNKNYSLKAKYLAQATNAELFYEGEDVERNQILFVGNSRKVMRPIIKDLLDSKYQVDIFGANWRGLVPSNWIKGEHIANAHVRKYYGGARILLNDHWATMRDNGFISNRIYDALAAGATIISDHFEELEQEFGEFIYTYRDKEELVSKIESLLNEGSSKESASAWIAANHTFQNRASVIIDTVETE
ncbi:MAG: glycosyltransferase [Saprospiraceae bacterium]|nr:glycosyltransferase [Saprospiraceae bacterium]